MYYNVLYMNVYCVHVLSESHTLLWSQTIQQSCHIWFDRLDTDGWKVSYTLIIFYDDKHFGLFVT